MRFWDSSAVVPLLVPEVTSRAAQRLFARDPVIVAWWATEIECTSAIARRQRLGDLRGNLVAEAFVRLSARGRARGLSRHEADPLTSKGSARL